MSGPAMHRVLLLGPRDLERTIVLLVIADFVDTDIGGKGAAVSGRLMADRARITHWKARAMLGSSSWKVGSSSSSPARGGGRRPIG